MPGHLNMQVTTCPFCGVVTDVPHNTQEGCIEALQDEVVRMRRLLEQVKPTGACPAPPEAETEEDPESKQA